jgi:flavodoxin
VYYSHSGNNEKLAYELKGRTGYELFQAREKRKRKTISILWDTLFKRNSKLSDYFIDLKKYGNVIFVAPIWNGKIATPMRTFLQKEKNNIKNYCFIAVCNGEDGQKEQIYDELLTITNHSPHNVTELSINSLLPEEHRNKVKYTFNYRISAHDLQCFHDIIESFVNNVVNIS